MTRYLDMTLYLDTEFNGYRGSLISLALVPERESVPEFYEVRELPAQADPFVEQHVIPVLEKTALGPELFKKALWSYLLDLPARELRIIADWPEDIAHLMNEMVAPGGIQVARTPKLVLVTSGKLSPAVPHNALSDARALRKWCRA